MSEASPSVHPNVYIFNQYYVELLKLCKAEAKKVKDDSKPARDLLRAIKKHYASFDKLDAGHLTFFRESAGEAIANYMATTDADLDTASIWYKGDVTFGTIATLVKTSALQHQYCLLFGLLIQEGVDGAEVVKMLQGEEVMMDSWSPENVTAMRRLMQVSAEVSKAGAANASSPFPGLEDLESTSLGRLAKEIMEDPEVKNLQDAMRNMGTGDGAGPADIFSMLGGGGNSEASGGIAKLMGTVSQKMVQKLMSGEIKQETLLQDAMTFAGKMQGMIPGGMMGDLSKLGGMLGGLGGLGAAMGGDAGGGAGGGFDMSQLMSMMGGAMGGGGASSSQKKAGAARMAQKTRHTSAADRAKRKLAARRLDAADAAEAKP